MVGSALPRALLGLLLLPAVCLPAPPARAASLQATVTDDRGRPVADAVVFATPAAGAAAVERRPGPVLLDQRDKEFIPHVLAVEVGTAVRFPNNDNIRHHVYSFSAAKKFELPLYSGLPAEPVVFDRPGVVQLGCNIHDWMLAYVYVLATPFFAKTGAEGTARLAALAPGPWDVRVWHPRLRGEAEATTQRLDLGGAGAARVAFSIGLKREWRIPRPSGPGYDPGSSP